MDFVIVDDFKPQVPSQAALADYETRTYFDVVYTPEDAVRADAECAQSSTESSRSSQSSDSSKAYTSASFYDAFVRRTANQCALEAAAPQRSMLWLDARAHCITASNFGAAAGHNKYMSPRALVIDKLWNVFKGNAFTAYGTFHEPDAAKSLEALLKTSLKLTLEDMYAKAFKGQHGLLTGYELIEVGLLKSHECPWMAVSPDGLLRLDGTCGPAWVLVEYKCPARLRHTDGHPYSTSPRCVPEYYMDQMQGIMGLLPKLGRPCLGALFVVWQPRQVHVTRVPFEQTYYTDVLEPALRNWYFTMYLPLAVLKANGQLVPGTDTGASVLDLDLK